MPTQGYPAGSMPSILPPSYVRTPDDIVFEDDFTGLFNASNTINAAKWYSAGVGTEVLTTEATGESGGWVIQQTGTSSADSHGVRGNAAFVPAAGRQIAFGAYFKMASVTSAAGFVGIALPITNNNVLSKLVAGTLTVDGVGFYVAAGGTIYVVVGNGTTSTTTAFAAPTGYTTPTVAAATAVSVSFVINGTDSVQFYVNGIPHNGKITANIPTNVQAVTSDVQTATTAAKTLSLDFIGCYAGR